MILDALRKISFLFFLLISKFIYRIKTVLTHSECISEFLGRKKKRWSRETSACETDLRGCWGASSIWTLRTSSQTVETAQDENRREALNRVQYLKVKVWVSRKNFWSNDRSAHVWQGSWDLHSRALSESLSPPRRFPLISKRGNLREWTGRRLNAIKGQIRFFSWN